MSRLVAATLFLLIAVPLSVHAQDAPPYPTNDQLGFSWSVPLDPDTRVILGLPRVTEVFLCSVAHRNGLRPGDEILDVDGRRGRLPWEFFPDDAIGTRYELRVVRMGRDTLMVPLEVGPKSTARLQLSVDPNMPSFDEAECSAPSMARRQGP